MRQHARGDARGARIVEAADQLRDELRVGGQRVLREEDEDLATCLGRDPIARRAVTELRLGEDLDDRPRCCRAREI
jgi:hypothetical protein